MIWRIGDCALSSALFSPTIPLLYDVTRGSPDDEFRDFGVKVKLFAYDAKLYVKVVNALAIDELQQALTASMGWWTAIVDFYYSKCCVLCIGKVNATGQFHIKDVRLPIVTSCSDLGITVSSNLSFSKHIMEQVRYHSYNYNAKAIHLIIKSKYEAKYLISVLNRGQVK